TPLRVLFALSLHDALPIYVFFHNLNLNLFAFAHGLSKVRKRLIVRYVQPVSTDCPAVQPVFVLICASFTVFRGSVDSFRRFRKRSAEHTSELQSRENLVCR